jgi:hypothetical protein
MVVYILFQKAEWETETYIVGVYSQLETAEKERDTCLKEYDQDYYIEAFDVE